MAARMQLLAALLGACMCGVALGFAVPSATLNQLTQQRTITLEQQEKNPYGLFPITINKGKLVKGNFLATNWNDANNNPGQGHTILQVTPSGQVSTFATINPSDPKITAECGTQGVGLTMALVVLSKGYVVVGSTPVPVGSSVAGPGCLILLDAQGNVLDSHAANELTTSGTMTGGGPWAMAVQDQGTTANLFVSYVLGDNPASTNTLSGVHGGMVVRYGLQLPGGIITPRFWGPQPDVIAAGFPTTPGGITGGSVGPTGLVLGSPVSKGSYNKGLQNNPLFIANNLASSVQVVYQAPDCFMLTGASPQCTIQTVASLGLINGPIGLAQSPQGTIVGANGGIGTLFEVAPLAGQNLQLASQLVDNVNAAPNAVVGAGNLFNVMFHPNVPNTLFFNDDNFNSFNKLTMQ